MKTTVSFSLETITVTRFLNIIKETHKDKNRVIESLIRQFNKTYDIKEAICPYHKDTKYPMNQECPTCKTEKQQALARETLRKSMDKEEKGIESWKLKLNDPEFEHEQDYIKASIDKREANLEHLKKQLEELG